MDATCFRHIVMPYYEPMYRIALSVIGDSDDAQDAVQEAVTKLWANRSKLRHVRNAEAFCLTVARNAAIDMLNARKPEGESVDDVHDTPADSVDIADRIDAQDALGKVESLIKALDPMQRDILMMRSYSDLPLTEIAKIKGITHDNARAILSRARKKLKDLYIG